MVLLTYVQILPSGHGPAATGSVGLALEPFRGVRYAQEKVTGLAEVTSPPYDVIAHDTADKLLAADPHNIVRLILPRQDPGRPGGQYGEAARLLREWQDQGILVPDTRPALYVYEQSTDDHAPVAEGGLGTSPDARPGAGSLVQRGLIGALRLAPPAAGIVLPHEEVMPGPVAGRRQLMEATQANLEPIFLLYDGNDADDGDHDSGGGRSGSAASRLVDDVAVTRPPLLTADTGDGMRHRIWALTDPAEHAAVAADLAPRQALIADGNHRYAAYLEMQAYHREAGDPLNPWDYGLALLVDSAAYRPRIGAIHRVLPGLDPSEAVHRAKGAFTVRTLPGGRAALPAALATLAEAAQQGTAFLVAGRGEIHLLTDPDPAQVAAAMPAGRSARWRALAASVLQELLMARLWGIVDDERRVRVVHHDAARAIEEAEGASGTAVICTPLSQADVYAVAAHGERLPRKSTSFAPKPRTGLVIRTLAEG
jgi:uncharacterized protein (DUF1015 family)